MRSRPITWLIISLLCFLGAAYFWELGNRWSAQKKSSSPPTNAEPVTATRGSSALAAPSSQSSVRLLTTAGTLNQPSTPDPSAKVPTAPERLKYRISNTDLHMEGLLRSPNALLLENAILDATQPIGARIPGHLRAQGDPGAFIIQSAGTITPEFRRLVQMAGGEIISYIPNNALLVRGKGLTSLQGVTGVQAVLPYEPFYKLKSSLLRIGVEQEALPSDAELRVLLFSATRDTTVKALEEIGAQVLHEARSPFGPIVRIKPVADSLPALVGLSGVQSVEIARARVSANDLTRQRTGVASNSIAPLNYLGLTGNGIVVNLNDTGVDASHPDLQGRVFADVPIALVDTNGHGTHAAGIIASSGGQSLTVSNASGSIMPPTNGQFRGMAPAARIFAMPSTINFGPYVDDEYLQETAARTNVFISNNSWHYVMGNDYDMAASSYDAAVRDALPEITGSQPLLFVFPSGNDASGNDSGQGGLPDSIPSPATAKNVITVGAIESLRNITNDVWKCTSFFGDTNATCITNQPWQFMTDANNQVAGFSSRGNVGIGIEGDFGRFKPDVVAPGTFILSTRSSTWDTNAYYNPSNSTVNAFQNQMLDPGALFQNSIFVPDNAVAIRIEVMSSSNTNLYLPIFVKQSDVASGTNYDFVRTNVVAMPPDNGPDLAPKGTDWFYTIGNPNTVPVMYDIMTTIVTTNDNGNYFEVLRGINEAVGPYYRYETGSSMSAAQVSGTLALMQEFFEQRMGRTNSPALMKALLINGARSVGNLYDFQVNNTVNYQGWGLVNLPNSLPAAISNALSGLPAPMQMFDQDPLNALATGQRHTRNIAVTRAAQAQPLRFTLVWTDPPGNPIAGVKLVNNLDLIVTNLDTGAVYYGNNMPSGFDYTQAWDTNTAPQFDVVNNVENVFIPAPTGTNFSVTVLGRQVNVNAVPGHPNDVAQDYALVVSSANPRLTDALTVTTLPLVSRLQPNVTVISNQFSAGQRVSGAFLQEERVGANTPLLGTTDGMTNQWHFYVLTNSNENFTNAAFVTFIPANLGLPRMGTREWDVANATRVEADIDLYVSTDPNLTNLSPTAIANARRSRTPGGTEYVYLTNVPNATTYYVGVKAEDQQAAQYGFFGMFSDLPLQQGPYVQGWPLYQPIPDGSPDNPGGALIFFPAMADEQVRRVVVTNMTMVHEMPGDLLANLSHDRTFVVLHNHTCVQIGSDCATNYNYIYEDNGEGDFPGSKESDGPGDLRDFIGVKAAGPWFLTLVDNSPVHTGLVANVWLKLEPEDLNEDWAERSVAAGAFTYDFIDVPVEATNLTVCLSNSLPLEIYLRRDELPTRTDYDKTLTVNSPGGCITLNKSDLPPLSAGRWYIGVFNPNASVVRYLISAKVDLDLTAIRPLLYDSSGVVPILDDAVTYDSMFVTNNQRIARLDVGLRVDHPRISDMVFHLISPQGTRVLLFENRGGPNAVSMGGGVVTTNVQPQVSSGDFNANTNLINVGQNQGTIIVDYDFFTIPDAFNIIYDGRVIFDSGPRTGTGRLAVDFGPGTSTDVSLVMNPTGNSDTNTLWGYTVTVVSRDFGFFTFTDNTNLTTTPIKFAPPPYGGITTVTTTAISDFEVGNGTYTAPALVDGWTLDNTNPVAVINGPAPANSGANYLSLMGGSISRTLPTTSGQNYVVRLASRTPGRLDGIVSWWKADLTGQDAVTNNHGTLASGATYDTGLSGSAFKFQSPGDQVLVPDRANLNPAQLTLEAWVRMDSTPTNDYAVIAGKVDSFDNTRFYAIGVETNSNGLFLRSDMRTIFGPYHVTGTLNVQTGVWYHVAMTYDGANFRQYVNGVLDVSIPVSANLAISALPLRIGSDQSGAWSFTGLVDETALYNRALSAVEIADIYNAGPAGKCGMASPPAVCGNSAQVFISGQPAGLLGVSGSTNWVTNSYAFVASTAGTPLRITPANTNAGILIDSVVMTSGGGIQYVHPEESLEALTGENSYGLWRLEMWDTRAGEFGFSGRQLIGWQLRFVFDNMPSVPTDIDHGTPTTNNIPPGQIAYYTVDVPSWAKYATNILVFSSGLVDMYFNQLIPPTGTNAGDFTLLSGSTGGSYVLSTNSTPPLIPSTRYYLGVKNVDTVNVTVVVQVDFDVTPLTNAVPFLGGTGGSPLQRFFYFDVSTNATAVSFELSDLLGDMDLIARRGLPLPNLANFDYGSFNPGTSDEGIIVFTNSQPVPLQPGRYFLGVLNTGLANTPYTLLATEYTNIFPTIVTLTNTVPYAGTNAGVLNATNDYYRFVVTPQALGVRFEILGATGDMSLVARKGLPLPDLGGFDYISANPGLQDELIQIATNSAPVPLSPGDWFLTAVNVSGAPVSYNILATEIYTLPDTNVVVVDQYITNNSFCLTWISVPGNSYYVEGITDFGSTNWVNVSGQITATSTLTTWCLGLPSEYHFFRVIQGIPPNPPPVTDTEVPVDNVTVTTNSICLTWTTVPGANYYVQGVTQLGGTNWTTLTNITATSTSTTWCLDRPTPYQFFRVMRAATPPPVVDTEVPVDSVSITTNSLCLSWTTVPGRTYYVQGVTQIGSTNWVNVSAPIVATGTVGNYCVPLPSTYQFFRVMEGVPVNPPVTGTEVQNVNTSLVGTNLCLSWVATIGDRYYIQGVSQLGSTNWANVFGPITATNTAMSWCTGVPSTYQFFRVMKGTPGTPPLTGAEVPLDSISRLPAAVQMKWTGPLGETYTVERASSILGPWVAFPTKVTSTSTTYTFLDTAEPGGFSQGLFYRITDSKGVEAKIDAIGQPPGVIQMRWTGPIGATYRVEWAPSVDAPWVPFTQTVNSATTTYSFVDDGSQTGGTSQIRFYRVFQIQ